MMKANDHNEFVECVLKTDKGVKIYALKDVKTISAQRGMDAEKARRFAELNISKEEFTKLIKSAKDAFNLEQDLGKVISIIYEMEFRNNFICEENSLLDLAYIYFFLEGEDIKYQSPVYNEKKKQLVEKDPLVRSFFLESALALTKRFSEKQEKELLFYLEEIKILSQRIYRYISHTQIKSSGSSMPG